MRDADPGGVTVAKKTELISVKIDPEVYRLVRTAAAWKGVNVSEYLSEAVRPTAERDCAKINKAAGKGNGDKGDA